MTSAAPRTFEGPVGPEDTPPLDGAQVPMREPNVSPALLLNDMREVDDGDLKGSTPSCGALSFSPVDDD